MTDQFKKVIADAAEEMNKLNAMDVSEPTKIDHSNLTVITCGEVEEPKQEEVKKVSPVRFLMYKVTNGIDSCKVWYSESDYEYNGERVQHITVYEKGYSRNLHEIFPGAQNESDAMTDYFEESRYVITPDSPYWNDAKAIVEKINAKAQARREKRMAKYSK